MRYGRPIRSPCARAFLVSARRRSCISARSNPPMAPAIWKMRQPDGVLRSKLSLRLTNATAMASMSAGAANRCLSGRLKRSRSTEASEQTIMAIAGHVSRQMLEHHSHIRLEAKRTAVAALSHVTIASQFAGWTPVAEMTKDRQLIRKTGNPDGRGDWIRTSDPLRPRQVRYQAALRPDRWRPRSSTLPAHQRAGAARIDPSTVG
jgi:hypothetical protein